MKYFFVVFTLPFYLFCVELFDLEQFNRGIVLETRQICIPEFPTAFNPSILRWKGKYLLSFRVIPNPKYPFVSLIGLVWLDNAWKPVGKAELLKMRDGRSGIPSRAEDGRLIALKDRLFLVYSDNTEFKLSKGGFRVHIAEIECTESSFTIKSMDRITTFEGETRRVREKNWTPFVYQNSLLLAYTLNPHKIFQPSLGYGQCSTLYSTEACIDWKWGELRGGTPAVLDECGEYLGFFHTVKPLNSVHIDQTAHHYFIGAYTFSAAPPFSITRISPEPIVGKGFYGGPVYRHYWQPVRVVFPGGYIREKNHFWLAFGKQDHEMWIAKLDRKKLLDSLVRVDF